MSRTFLSYIAFLSVALWGISEARHFLIPLCLAILLAFLLTPPARWLRKRGAPEWVAVLAVTVLLLCPLAWIAYESLTQGQALLKETPEILSFFRREATALASSDLGRRLNLDEYLDLDTLTTTVGEGAGAGLEIVVHSLRTVVGAGGKFVIVLVFSVLMVALRGHLRTAVERIVAAHLPNAPVRLIDSVIELVERFLLVRLGLSLLVAALDCAILRAFGLRYSLLMGGFLGICTLVPVVGFLLGVIPPAVLAFASAFPGGRLAAMLLALYGVSNVEGHFLAPKLLGHHLNLNLLATFLAIFAGEALWGGWGMFLSIPILGVIRILLVASPGLEGWGMLLSEATPRPPRTRRRQKSDTR
jgi:predicted PurR-regulated permease PerM